MPESMTKDRLARLYKVCRHLEKMGVVPEGSCNRLQALSPAPTPGLPPATFQPVVPPPIVVDPKQPEPPGFDPATLLPGADQIPVVPGVDQIPVAPGVDQIPVAPTPPPLVTPGLPLTTQQMPKPASVFWPQVGVGGGAGYFTGVRPGTYAYPSSIQVDSKGRVVSIHTGSAPESADLCLTSYLVSTNANGAPYTSIQAAYDAAKVDGHDETNPAQVLVCPGVYTEDIIFDQAGIDIIAIAQDPFNELRDLNSDGITKLVGNLTIDLDIAPPGIANNTCAWRGIDIDMRDDEGAARDVIIFGGTDPQRAYISDCMIVTRGNSNVISGANSGSGSVLDMIRCGMINPAGPNGEIPTLIDWDDGTIELTDCHAFFDSVGNLADIELGAEFFATGCSLSGNWDNAGDVVCRHCTLIGSIDVSNINATFEITNCEIDTAGIGAGQLVTGAGTFTYDEITWTGGTQGTFNTPASNLETVQLESTPPGAFHDILAAATYTVTTESSMIMDTDGGAQVVNLPPAPRRCGPIRMKEIGSAAGGMRATPNGTDTINRGGAGAHVVVPTTGYTFVSDGISNWETFD